MRCCFGVSSTLPETVIKRLPRGSSYSYTEPSTTDVLLVSGVDALSRLLPTISVFDIAVIVFDAQVKLDSWCITSLDLSCPIKKQLTGNNKIKYKIQNPIAKLLKRTASSFVSNFITLTYKTRDSEKQALLRKEVFAAFWRGDRQLYANSLNKKNSGLIALLNSSAAIVLETALQEVKAGKNLDVTAKSYKLSTFDLNYVIKFQSKYE